MKQKLINKLLEALKEYESLGIADQIDCCAFSFNRIENPFCLKILPVYVDYCHASFSSSIRLMTFAFVAASDSQFESRLHLSDKPVKDCPCLNPINPDPLR